MSSNEPLYPGVEVQLSGEDGNAFFIIGRTTRALKQAGHKEAADEFTEEAMSSDYDHLLRTVMKYVSTD